MYCVDGARLCFSFFLILCAFFLPFVDSNICIVKSHFPLHKIHKRSECESYLGKSSLWAHGKTSITLVEDNKLNDIDSVFLLSLHNRCTDRKYSCSPFYKDGFIRVFPCSVFRAKLETLVCQNEFFNETSLPK